MVGDITTEVSKLAYCKGSGAHALRNNGLELFRTPRASGVSQAAMHRLGDCWQCRQVYHGVFTTP